MSGPGLGVGTGVTPCVYTPDQSAVKILLIFKFVSPLSLLVTRHQAVPSSLSVNVTTILSSSAVGSWILSVPNRGGDSSRVWIVPIPPVSCEMVCVFWGPKGRAVVPVVWYHILFGDPAGTRAPIQAGGFA